MIYFFTLKKFLYADTLGVLHHKKSDFRGRSVCLSGSLDNLTLENSRVVQEDEEGDFLGLFRFVFSEGCRNKRCYWVLLLVHGVGGTVQ